VGDMVEDGDHEGGVVKEGGSGSVAFSCLAISTWRIWRIISQSSGGKVVPDVLLIVPAPWSRHWDS
jgi:hypothetical protein